MMEGVVTRFYIRIFQWFGGDHAMISVVGSYVVMVSSFWLTNALLLYMDVTGKPRWTQKYRVQKNQNTPIDRVKLKKALKTAVFNNILLNGLLTYPVYWTEKSWGCRFHPNELPTVSRFLLEMAVFGVIQETIFYYSHRLFHHPKLYRRVHKKHHEWTAPIGIVAIYATPAEYLTGNGLSVLMGPLVVGSHIMTIWVWFAIASIGTSIHHSGYHLPLLPSPEFHDFHHLTFNWNFGTFGWLDRLHNTDAEFRGTPQRKRHRTLLGLTPLSITYPDEDKKEQKDCKKRG